MTVIQPLEFFFWKDITFEVCPPLITHWLLSPALKLTQRQPCLSALLLLHTMPKQLKFEGQIVTLLSSNT